MVTYKLVRFLKAKLLPEEFEIDKAMIERYRKIIRTSGGLLGGDGPKPRKIQLSFDWSLRKILRERKFHPTQKLKTSPSKSGERSRILVTLEAPVDEDLLNWVRRWGVSVKVIKPRELKISLLEYADFLQKTYPEAK